MAPAKEISLDAATGEVFIRTGRHFHIKRTKNSNEGFLVDNIVPLYCSLALAGVPLTTTVHSGWPRGSDMRLMSCSNRVVS